MTEEPETRTVPLGGRFTIDLPANPTTGYDWQVAFPPERVRLEGREHVRDSDRIGAGGKTTFTFRALSVGEATLRFRYLRVWEGTPIEERVVTVRVQPGP